MKTDWENIDLETLHRETAKLTSDDVIQLLWNMEMTPGIEPNRREMMKKIFKTYLFQALYREGICK